MKLQALVFALALAALFFSGCTNLNDSLDPCDENNHRFRDPDQQSLVKPEAL